MAEREEEPDPERSLAVLEELSGRVVDRRDVIGVEGVPQPEGERQRPQTGQRGVAVRVEDEEAPSHDVETQDCGSEGSEPNPLRP